jgi:hypothetical protein
MATQKLKATYYYKLFRVKRNDGRVTTVSIDPILATRACQVMGSLRTVGKLVREAALSYEDGMYKNCSGFVSQQLREAVAGAMSLRALAQHAGVAQAAH